MTLKIATVLFLLSALPSCNWTSQLDRDFGACVTLSKGGAKCSVETAPAATGAVVTPPAP